MLKKIRFNDSIGAELENRMEVGDFRPTELDHSSFVELERRAKQFLESQKRTANAKKKKKS